MSERHIAKNLSEVIDFLGLNQAEFAELIGVTPAAISQILSGKRIPSLPVVIKILEKTNIKFEKLVKP